MLKGHSNRPTSFEKIIINIVNKYNLLFKYTGNGKFWIGNKNPDFVNKKKKIAIEVYSNYFKIRDYGSIKNYEKERSEYFDKYGWNTIFINEKEIKSEDIILGKIENGNLGKS